MTTHVRQQIREAAATVVGNLTTTGTRVHQSRMRAREAAALPCLLVETHSEQVADANVGELQERELELTIRGFAKATADLDDTLDDIALEVETAMAGSPTLGGKCTGQELRGIRVVFDDDTDKPVGSIALDYRITYFTQAGTPGTLA